MAKTKEMVEVTKEDGRGKGTGLHLSVVDQIKRLKQIQELKNEGKNGKEIAEILGISEPVVSNNLSYLRDLQIADLTSQDIAGKRAELFLQLSEVENEVKTQYEQFKDVKAYSNDARAYLRLWKDVIEAKARMFGVDVIKTEGIVINQQINTNTVREVEKMSLTVRDKIAKAIVDNHETEIRQKFEDENEV